METLIECGQDRTSTSGGHRAVDDGVLLAHRLSETETETETLVYCLMGGRQTEAELSLSCYLSTGECPTWPGSFV